MLETIDERIKQLEYLAGFTPEDREDPESMTYEEKQKYVWELIEIVNGAPDLPSV